MRISKNVLFVVIVVPIIVVLAIFLRPPSQSEGPYGGTYQVWSETDSTWVAALVTNDWSRIPGGLANLSTFSPPFFINGDGKLTGFDNITDGRLGCYNLKWSSRTQASLACLHIRRAVCDNAQLWVVVLVSREHAVDEAFADMLFAKSVPPNCSLSK